MVPGLDVGPMQRATLPAMASRIMVIADEAWARDNVHAALTEPDFTLVDHSDPATARDALVAEKPVAVVIDLQVGNMGGMAIARELHQQSALKGEDEIPVVLLLDRAADSFLAKRAGVAAWVTKPFGSHDIRTAVEHALAT
jgi:two-component system response regulator MprA